MFSMVNRTFHGKSNRVVLDHLSSQASRNIQFKAQASNEQHLQFLEEMDNASKDSIELSEEENRM